MPLIGTDRHDSLVNSQAAYVANDLLHWGFSSLSPRDQLIESTSDHKIPCRYDHIIKIGGIFPENSVSANSFIFCFASASLAGLLRAERLKNHFCFLTCFRVFYTVNTDQFLTSRMKA